MGMRVTEMVVLGTLLWCRAAADVIADVKAADERVDATVAAIATPDELAARQTDWRRKWLDMMGGMPAVKTPLAAQVTGVIPCDGYRVEKVLFQSLPGVYVTGLLYLPDSPKYALPYPGLLVVHGHSQAGKMRDGYRRMAILAAQAGFGVFAPDPISQGERRQGRPPHDRDCALEHASIGARGWLVGWNFARFRIWDCVRAIDYMETRPELDLSRLGVCGNSGGGTMSAYIQAFDDRIKVAAPNCYVSSIREVFREHGAHDAEQFFFGQLRDGFNHAALVALGQPRVDLLIGARHADYFPIAGVRTTYALARNLHDRLGFSNRLAMYSCDGPHGWAESSRQAALAWMKFCVKGETTAYCDLRDGTFFFDVEALRKIPGDFTFGTDKLPFPPERGNVTATGQVRDLQGFKSLYALIADEATRLSAVRRPLAEKGAYREIVRRRAGIRPLAELRGQTLETDYRHQFDWWYLGGREGVRAENHTAMLSTLGRSRVGVKAEDMIQRADRAVAANGGSPVPLKAKGADCIAAAHAYAAEPQLFSGVELVDPPPSWTEMCRMDDPRKDSYSIAVWGALQEYDWTDLVRRP